MQHVDGYYTADDYMATWQPEMAPAWLDHVAAYAGVAAPRARHGAAFRYCELGCGLGWSLNLLAAANPEGRFVGIDAMQSQVTHARSVARAAGLENVRFLHCTLEEATARRLARCDYVAAHGLYTWISDENAERLFALANRVLKPGGLFYLGYNTEPGWSALRPAQRLLSELAGHLSAPAHGTALHGALDVLEALHEAGARGLPVAGQAASMLARLQRSPGAYLAHEFLNRCWRPVFVTEAHGRAREHGLDYVGSARLSHRRSDFVLRRAERAIVDAQPEGALRELVRALCLGESFRSDVFARQPQRLSPSRAWSQRLRGHFALSAPRRAIVYEAATPAGRIRFDKPAARAVTRALEDGPCRLRSVHARGGRRRCTDGDLLEVLDALLCATLVTPVDPRKTAPRAPAMNALLRRAVASADPGWRGIHAQVGRHGTASRVAPLDLVLMEAAPAGNASVAAIRRHMDAAGLEATPGAADGEDEAAALRKGVVGWPSRRRLLRALGIV